MTICQICLLNLRWENPQVRKGKKEARAVLERVGGRCVCVCVRVCVCEEVGEMRGRVSKGGRGVRGVCEGCARDMEDGV